MNKLNTKKFHILHEIFSISEIGVVVLFFLLPYIAVASPISKELILKLTNKERQSQNLILLEQNPILEQAAQKKAKDIMEKQYFAHTNPDGRAFYEWVDESGYNYAYAGENLAIDFDEAEDAMAAWMASPKHRENILNENYSEMGVGIIDGIFESRPSTIIVQIFGQPFMQINKLNKYNSLEEQAYGTLIRGESDKVITDVPMKNENGFMLNTPLTIEKDEAKTYSAELDETENDESAATSTSIKKEKPNAPIKFSLTGSIGNTEKGKSFPIPSFDFLLIITAAIIILSVYGSILERIKSSLQIHRHWPQLH